MKMELTIKHLAPYLPYGLKFATNSGKLADVSYSYSGLHLTKKSVHPMHKDHVFTVSEKTFLRNYKPILRPVADLAKNIDGSGSIYEKTFNLHALQIDTDLDVNIEDHGSNYVSLLECYETLQVLFEYHFDVFGLIDAGLAINANKLTAEQA